MKRISGTSSADDNGEEEEEDEEDDRPEEQEQEAPRISNTRSRRKRRGSARSSRRAADKRPAEDDPDVSLSSSDGGSDQDEDDSADEEMDEDEVPLRKQSARQASQAASQVCLHPGQQAKMIGDACSAIFHNDANLDGQTVGYCMWPVMESDVTNANCFSRMHGERAYAISFSVPPCHNTHIMM